MSYIEQSLSKGEQVYQIFPHHWFVNVVIAIHFIFAIITVGIWLIPAILIWLSWKKRNKVLPIDALSANMASFLGKQMNCALAPSKRCSLTKASWVEFWALAL